MKYNSFLEAKRIVTSERVVTQNGGEKIKRGWGGRNELLLVTYPRGKAKLDPKVASRYMKDMNSDRQIQSPES